MLTIKHECHSCSGTGLYCGFAEPKGTAVICLTCNGQGWSISKFNEFVGRKKRKGVNTIRKSRGSFLVTGVGGTGESMTYEQFEKSHPVRDDTL